MSDNRVCISKSGHRKILYILTAIEEQVESHFVYFQCNCARFCLANGVGVVTGVLTVQGQTHRVTCMLTCEFILCTLCLDLMAWHVHYSTAIVLC